MDDSKEEQSGETVDWPFILCILDGIRGFTLIDFEKYKMVVCHRVMVVLPSLNSWLNLAGMFGRKYFHYIDF